MLVLQTQGLIAFAFAVVKIQMQYAVAAPYVGIRQQVFQQSARVAVACQQQLGLFGIVWRDFGVEQALAVAAACLRCFACLQNHNAYAVFRQFACSRCTGNACADNQDVFGRGLMFRPSEPRF